MNPPDLKFGATSPVAERRPTKMVHHRTTLTDDYAWLRADNWQDVMRDTSLLADDIRDYLDAENKYLEAVMAPTKTLQETLFEEMKGRIKQDDSSVPVADGPFAYATKFVEGAEHPQFVRTDRGGKNATILIDGDAMAKAHDFFRLGGVAHSPDHKLIAYACDTTGSEYYQVRVRNADTLEDRNDDVADTSGNVVWANDGQSFFYVRQDENHRPSKVFRHIIGDKADNDELIYNEEDSGLFVGIGETQSRKYILISIHDHETSEVYRIDADDPDMPPVLVLPREDKHEYDVEHHGDRLFFLTNRDGAEDFKIVSAPIETPTPDHWQDVVPHKPGCLIISFVLLANHLVRLERQDGLPQIIIREIKSGAEHEISFDEEAYSLGMSAGYEFETNEIRFTYSSMTTPARTYDYNMETRKRVLRKEQEVPSGHDPADYVTRRILAESHDGAKVPISILYHRTTPLDGSAPALLYGYGAYGISIPASFSTTRLSLVDRGFVYAIAHIRGGKDRGYAWYRHGKMFEKKNTFLDFIAAGETLIAENFTTKGQIVAQGGSAGGMLMGATANMAPEMFLGMIAEVPFVDVLNTMLDATLPLTPPEWPEWGNPIENSEAFQYIRSYSPYDNVAAKGYPHMLITGGLADPRVTYWEPAKWAAKLRAMRTDDRLTLLKTNMQAGHAGKPGRFDSLQELSLTQAFALMIADRLKTSGQ